LGYTTGSCAFSEESKFCRLWKYHGYIRVFLDNKKSILGWIQLVGSKGAKNIGKAACGKLRALCSQKEVSQMIIRSGSVP
jgi:hypothetical protein